MHSAVKKGYVTLRLERAYLPSGTNGTLLHNGQPICGTIELPWQNNARNVSCIPEGRYRLERIHSRRFGQALRVLDVPKRSGILLHAANHAETELRGCIAPVTKHNGPGRGLHSRVALERVLDLVVPVLEAGETVWLEISWAKPYQD